MSAQGHGAIGWDRAREVIAQSVPPGTPESCPLGSMEGCVTAEAVRAPRPLPHFDSAAMDGFAVRGGGPWLLAPGVAEPIVTGALVPEWCEAIVPREEAVLRPGGLAATRPPQPGRHLRRAGDEAPAGAVLVPAGVRLRPPHLALIAIAGLDDVPVRRPPGVTLLLTGDEIDGAGLPAPGRVRDAFTPLLPPLVRSVGGTVDAVLRLGDDDGAIASALSATASPLVLSTGGTGRSSADALRRALVAVGARLLVDGVAMRPGHPTVIAALPSGGIVLALPGNPLAAALAALSFLPPAVDAASGARPAPLERGVVAEPLGRAGSTTLVPVRRGEDGWLASAATRSHMLSGLSVSEAVAVVPPDGVRAGDAVTLLRLPW